MHAPRERIFETAANLEDWPRLLPHYRYIKYLERGPERNVGRNGAVRDGIPISWLSETGHRPRRPRGALHRILRAWTKGMRVVWSFRETPAGVLVEILQ